MPANRLMQSATKMNKMKNYLQLVALLFLTVTLPSSCDRFEYHTYETNRYKAPIEASNAYNLEQLLKIPDKDTLRLIFTGDTQRHYDDLKELVNRINMIPDVDAVFVAGDLIEFGLSNEFEWVCEELIRLNAPFLTAIGNHDCLANGIQIYQDIYGPLNYSFTWNLIRFVMHNTNGREFGFNGTAPDIAWMQQQLTDEHNFEATIFLSHVPPFHVDFDENLEHAYAQVVRDAKNTLFVAHGHNHHRFISQPYNDGIWYLNTSSPENRFFADVKIIIDGNSTPRFVCDFVRF